MWRSLSYSQCSKIQLIILFFFQKRQNILQFKCKSEMHSQISNQHTYTLIYPQTKWQWVRANETGRAKNRAREREGSRRPCDGGWHRSSQCGQGTQLRLELEAQARLCVQVPSHCPVHFHPSSTPTLPQLPRLLSANRIARGWRHSRATSKAWSGERLRAWCWHTTKSHTRERQKGSRGGQFKKKAVQTHPFSEKGISRTKHFILLPKPALCQLRIQQTRRDSFPPSLAFLAPPHLLLSAPTANGPLPCVNKRDNLIKKIQSSSLGNKVRFEWVQYVPPLPSTPHLEL